jgi:hypothetical protein
MSRDRSRSVSEAVQQLGEQYGSPAKKQVGRVFRILKHNYGVGFLREDILEGLANRKNKGETLQEIFNSMPFFDLQNKKDAKTLSLMVTDTDQWAVRFAEILLKDRQAAVDRITTWEYLDQVGILILFFVNYGFNLNAAKNFALLVASGMVISEARAYTTYAVTVGTGPIIYTMGGHLVRRLLSRRWSNAVIFQLAVFFVSIASGIYIDPPVMGGGGLVGVYTDHPARAVAFLVGYFLPI